MAPVRERHNFYFVGENVEGEIFCHEPDSPMSQLHAELTAKQILRGKWVADTLTYLILTQMNLSLMWRFNHACYHRNSFCCCLFL